MRLPVKPFVLLFAAAIVSMSALAQDIPLQNWDPVPWQPSHTGRISTNAYSAAFMPMAPCRVYDSRSATALPALTSRTINVDGGPCSGIPANASAYSMNITVFGSTASGSYEFVTAYAAGATRPGVSTMNFLTGSQTSSAATVPVGTAGDINIYTTYTTHFVLDINGYYTLYQNSGDGFASVSGSNVGVIGISTSSYGVQGQSSSSYGVVGITGGSSSAAGVLGSTTNGRGVMGSSTNFNGVWAESTNQDGLAAFGGRDGAYAQGARFGLVGSSTATTANSFGIVGTTASTAGDSAGVFGQDGGGRVAYTANIIPSGVRGESAAGIGTSGLSSWLGVVGIRANADGTNRVQGYLGYAGYGVYAMGNTGATGTKSFVEPHPTDARKVVKYVSLEGPEAGTYFRGRGVVSGGRAVIEVPESFRIVTDSEGLTVHITPMGRIAQVGVISADLNNIVVEATRDVEFSYIVYGVRKAFKDFQPIQAQDGEFMPLSADSVMPSGLPEESKRRLINTGVYHEDGTVNMETAERLGWTKIWRERGAVSQ